MKQTKFTLTNERPYYKPFSHEEFFNIWKNHEKSHWMPEECSMQDDINDWNNKLTTKQKDFLTNIFRFFTQGDIDVAGAYISEYLPFFKQIEVRMMMLSFAAREAIHIHAYSYLIESIGMPESTYKDFMNYDEMKAKHEYIRKFSSFKDLVLKEELSVEDKEKIASGIALFSGFVEGMQLFSTFAMLLMFPLHGLMRKMGQVVTWSINDESYHIFGMIKVFNTFLAENPDINEPRLRENIRNIALEMVKLESDFIHLIFKNLDLQKGEQFFAMTEDTLVQYIKYIADRRLVSLGNNKIFHVPTNPLPQLAIMIDAPTHTNFFENNSTDYAMSSLSGNWSSVWA